jgi:transposase
MWTPEHRAKYKPITSRYTSDLSDVEYEVLEKFVPKYLRPRAHSLREILNGLFYILRNGVTYRNIPKDLPSRSTLHRWLQRFDEVKNF